MVPFPPFGQNGKVFALTKGGEIVRIQEENDISKYNNPQSNNSVLNVNFTPLRQPNISIHETSPQQLFLTQKSKSRNHSTPRNRSTQQQITKYAVVAGSNIQASDTNTQPTKKHVATDSTQNTQSPENDTLRSQQT